jgi:RHS repeat-associated protein
LDQALLLSASQAWLVNVLADGENTYLYENTVVAQISETQTGYYLPDVLGSVRLMTSLTGEVQLSQRFTPFGELKEKYGDAEANFGYTAQKYDAQTGLIYLRARYYAPGSGRFISHDTWSGDANMPMSYNAWLYGYGNPVRYTDPSGHYNRLAAVDYAMRWDHLDPTYDPNYNYIQSSDYSDENRKLLNDNQCTYFASTVLDYGGIKDQRIGIKGDSDSIPYWNIKGLVDPDGSNHYEATTVINTPTFYKFAITEIGKKVVSVLPDDIKNKNSEEIFANDFQNIDAGDLVFYDYAGGEEWDHVAIVSGWHTRRRTTGIGPQWVHTYPFAYSGEITHAVQVMPHSKGKKTLAENIVHQVCGMERNPRIFL